MRLSIIVSLVLLVVVSSVNAAPRLFFSDLTSGPATGWNNTSDKGCAVTIWGLGFGSANGTNHIDVGGQEILSNDSTFVAEWATTGTNNEVARGLERTTFWLKPTCTGSSGINITVNGVTSNTLAFTVRSGTIYYLANAAGGGSDSNSGRTIALPWLCPNKINNIAAGDIIYCRGGNHVTVGDASNSTYIMVRNLDGTSGNERAIVGYPCEEPNFDATVQPKLFRASNWESGTTPGSDYYVFSKLKITGNSSSSNNMFLLFGDYIRIIGCGMYDSQGAGQAGIIDSHNCSYLYMYGNIFRDVGNDNWGHLVYAKTKKTAPAPSVYLGDSSYQYFAYNEIDGFVDTKTDWGHNIGGGMYDIAIESDATDFSTHHFYIHSNYFHGCGGGYLYHEGGASNRTIHDIYFYNNLCVNNNEPATGYATAGFYTRNDYVYDVFIYNNTFYKGMGETYGCFLGEHRDMSNVGIGYLKNNICISRSDTPTWYFEGSGATGMWYSDYDLYHSKTPPTTGSYYTITHAIDPTSTFFTNEGTLDLTIQSGSEAHNTGTSAVIAAIPGTIEGGGCTVDYLGIPRPQGAGYDIGAYEYDEGGGSTTTTTATVTGISITGVTIQ